MTVEEMHYAADRYFGVMKYCIRQFGENSPENAVIVRVFPTFFMSLVKDVERSLDACCYVGSR